MITFQAAISLFWILGVDSAYHKCFTSTVCKGGGLQYSTRHHEVYPFPECCGNFTDGGAAQLARINKTLNNRVEKFRQELMTFTELSQSTDEEKCFAPVACNGRITWMQVFPSIFCYEDLTINFNTSGILTENMDDAIRILEETVTEKCGSCDTTSTPYMAEILRLRTMTIQSDSPMIKTECAAPVNCMGDVYISNTWLQIAPLPAKDGKQVMKTNLMNGASVISDLNNFLEKSYQVFKDLTSGVCAGCISTTTSS